MNNFYDFLIRLPDKLFIIPHKIDGELIFGERSYNYFIENNHFAIKMWREIFHLAGSILVVIISRFISNITGFKKLDIVILLALILFITFQEFYLHPKYYNQKLYEGILDWLFWVGPIIYYFIYARIT